jgi:hypothetical protein
MSEAQNRYRKQVVLVSWLQVKRIHIYLFHQFHRLSFAAEIKIKYHNQS